MWAHGQHACPFDGAVRTHGSKAPCLGMRHETDEVVRSLGVVAGMKQLSKKEKLFFSLRMVAQRGLEGCLGYPGGANKRLDAITQVACFLGKAYFGNPHAKHLPHIRACLRAIVGFANGTADCKIIGQTKESIIFNYLKYWHRQGYFDQYPVASNADKSTNYA